MGAKRRYPDDIGFGIIRPPSGIDNTQMFLFRVGVFECNEPATGTTFFTLHTLFSYEKRDKKSYYMMMFLWKILWIKDNEVMVTIFVKSVFQ